MYALPVQSSPRSLRRYDIAGRRIAILAGDDAFGIKVSGTSRHQDELQAIAGGRTAHSADELCAALLLPEPDNPHDLEAVGVHIEGFQIGYLERHQAPVFNRTLHGSGCFAAVCAAKVVGGWDRGDGDPGHFGVRLNAFLPFELNGDLAIENERGDAPPAILPPAAPSPLPLPPPAAISSIAPYEATLRRRKPMSAGLWLTDLLSAAVIAIVITLAHREIRAPDTSPPQLASEPSFPIPSSDLFRLAPPSAFPAGRPPQK